MNEMIPPPKCGLCDGSGTYDAAGEGAADECPVCQGTQLAAIPTEAEQKRLYGFKLAMMHCDMETHEETGLCECFERLLIMMRGIEKRALQQAARVVKHRRDYLAGLDGKWAKAKPGTVSVLDEVYQSILSNVDHVSTVQERVT